MLAIRDVWGWRFVAATLGLGTALVLALAPAPAPDEPAAVDGHLITEPPICVLPPAPVPVPAPPVAKRAILHTDQGAITCTLDAGHAPNTVANFIKLANNHLYDGTYFHRVIPSFMIQGGDPTGTGAGGPGYEFADEIAVELTFDRPGVLAMANRGKDTNGSQFFITDGSARWLDGRYTIFGSCDHPEIVHAIASAPRSANDRPEAPVTMTVTIE